MPGRVPPYSVGKRLSWWPTEPKDTEIIGVAGDAKYDNLKEPTPRLVYVSVLQEGPGPNFLQIRVSPRNERSIGALIADCRAAIRGVDPNIRIESFEPIRAEVMRTLAPELLVSSVSAGFGILALLLLAVGLYGVVAYAVSRRTPEFAIRLALGANTGRILRIVICDGLALTGVGIVAGTIVAALLSQLMTKLLFGVPSHDWVTFSLAAFILLLAATAASYGPARRVMAVEPVSALRYE